MNVQIAIVDDSIEYEELLSRYIKEFFSDKGNEYSISWFEDGWDILDDYKPNFDLIFMDIDMKKIDGMATAKEIRKIDTEVIIVFITNLAQYAVKGYEVGALDFIVKPLQYAEFVFKMEKILSHIELNQNRNMILHFGGGLYQISSDRLCYVEVRGHNLFYHLIDNEYEVRGNLSEVEENLKELNFIRCNSCYLINPKYVEWVKNNEIKVGKDILQISRNRKKQVLKELSDYISRGM